MEHLLLFQIKWFKRIVTCVPLSGALSLLAACGGAQTSNETGQADGLFNSPPVFATDANLYVREQSTVVSVLHADDAEQNPVTYSIAGGVDADLFIIDSHSGELRFKQAPDFEAPEDSNGNNAYVVVIAASDVNGTTSLAFTVTVIDDTPLTVNISPGHIRTLTLSWEAVPGATFYRLLVNADGHSGYTAVGEDVVANQIEVTVPVHLTDWVDSLYMLEAYDEQELIYFSDPESIAEFMPDSIGYIKASNAETLDRFGTSVALSAEGHTLAVGAWGESSMATGVDGDQNDNAAALAGAVYVFTLNHGEWTQQAYIKALNADAGDSFGESIALSADGNTLAVGVWREQSAATGIGADHDDNSAVAAGAVHVYSRTDGHWAQQAYIKASNTEAWDGFGESVALSADGNTLLVGAEGESSAAIGIGGDQGDNSVDAAGAVYVFVREEEAWAQQAYIKASSVGQWDRFGSSVALSADGHTLAVGADGEDSAATGVNVDQADNSADNAGAVFVFVRADGMWAQQAYIKASNADAEDRFGGRVALSADGDTLVVGANGEASAATGVGGEQNDDSAEGAGAVYLFTRADDGWAQQAYVKASNAERGDLFGVDLALSADGNLLAVGASLEGSAAKGVGGDQGNNFWGNQSGAVYVFAQEGGAWVQRAYVKAPNAEAGDLFGISVALSADGGELAVGASQEWSGARGIGGDQGDNTAELAGAVYLY